MSQILILPYSVNIFTLFLWHFISFSELSRNMAFSRDSVQYSSVQFSRSAMFDSLQPHESQNARPPCPSATPRVYPNSCPSSRWCHPAISSSVVPFSSCPQSLPASESFPMSQLFVWGGQSIGVSALASVLPMNTQDWSPLGWTGWITAALKTTKFSIFPYVIWLRVKKCKNILLPHSAGNYYHISNLVWKPYYLKIQCIHTIQI